MALSNITTVTKTDAEANTYFQRTVPHLSANWNRLVASPTPPAGGGGPAPAAAPADPRKAELEGKYNVWNGTAGSPGLYSRSKNPDTRTHTITGQKDALKEEIILLLRHIYGDIPESWLLPQDRVTLGIPERDGEPSPSHGSHLGTGAPELALNNMGGSIIDVRCRRTTDENKDSVPENYAVEVRWTAADTAPLTPDDTGMKTEVFSKSRNQITTGMGNLKKTFYCWARWKHKTNATFNSPWSNPEQITIS